MISAPQPQALAANGPGYRIFMLDPGPALAPWIYPPLLMQVDTPCVSRIPAAISPALFLIPRGACLALAPGGSPAAGEIPLPRVMLTGPTLQPRYTRCLAGTRFISLLFRPGYLAEALGPGVNELRDQNLPLEDFFSPGAVAALHEQLVSTDHPRQWMAAVARLLQGALRPRSDPRRAALLKAGYVDMFAPARQLAAAQGIGLRHLERRLHHAYGMNLRELRRIARFGFALAKLTGSPPARGGLTRLAQDFGFYDQSHLDREFTALAGESPSALLAGARGDDPGFWLYRLGRRDFRTLFLEHDVDEVQHQFAPLGAPAA